MDLAEMVLDPYGAYAGGEYNPMNDVQSDGRFSLEPSDMGLILADTGELFGSTGESPVIIPYPEMPSVGAEPVGEKEENPISDLLKNVLTDTQAPRRPQTGVYGPGSSIIENPTARTGAGIVLLAVGIFFFVLALKG